MPTKLFTAMGILLLAASLQAQDTVVTQDGPPPHAKFRTRVVIREMGKWWQNPEIAKKLQLSDSQVSQLDKVFYDHKLKLIDYSAAMQKEDLKLQNLLDADQPNEAQVKTQVDQVLAARGNLEREYTMMNLDLRKVLTVEQWRQLKTIRGGPRMPGGNVFFYRKFGGDMGGGMDGGPGPMPPPPPPGDLD
jgi:Spy/CpxP family protein refolding chaperone